MTATSAGRVFENIRVKGRHKQRRFLVTIEVNEEEFDELCKLFTVREVKKLW